MVVITSMHTFHRSSSVKSLEFLIISSIGWEGMEGLQEGQFVLSVFDKSHESFFENH